MSVFNVLDLLLQDRSFRRLDRALAECYPGTPMKVVPADRLDNLTAVARYAEAAAAWLGKQPLPIDRSHPNAARLDSAADEPLRIYGDLSDALDKLRSTPP